MSDHLFPNQLINKSIFLYYKGNTFSWKKNLSRIDGYTTKNSEAILWDLLEVTGWFSSTQQFHFWESILQVLLLTYDSRQIQF